jgi:hypothetical protein
MKKYQRLCEKIHFYLFKAAEKLAHENDESETGAVIMVEYNGIQYPFIVDLTISNYEYEEETNSADYNTSIYVTKVPVTKIRQLNEYFQEHILFETIYKD